ncbi:hypothetical protein MMC22_008420 [Lobaria immixta]|nr:hypothetical protein [Lobaria immixta]
MWSTFSSLHAELRKDIGAILTEYVRLVRIGKFAAAEKVFSSFSAVDRKVPLLCIERALGLFYQGRNAAVCAFVDEILADQELEPDQRALLLMINRFATIMARGAMFPALYRARNLRDELTSIHCVEIYARIINYAKRSSNWVTAADKQLLGRESPGTTIADMREEWAKLRCWLENLVSLDLWGPAQTILVLLSGGDPKKRSISFATSCDLYRWLSHEAEVRFADSTSEAEVFWLASIHLSFGQLLVSNQSTVDGRGHIRQARATLSRFSGHMDPVCFYPRIGVDLRLQEIKLDLVNTQDRIGEIDALVKFTQENEDLTSEGELLNEILDLKHDRQNLVELEGLLDRKEELEERLGPNVSNLINTRNKVWTITGKQQSGGLLEWYDRFERKYPTSPILRYGQPPTYPVDPPKTDDYFDIPMTLFYKAITKYFITGSLQEIDGFTRAQQEMNLFQSNIDMPFLQKVAEDMDNVYISLGNLSDFDSIVSTGLEVLVTLLQDSQRRQRLRHSDITAILQNGITDVPKADLSQLSTENVRGALYGAQVSSGQFLARMNAIQSWLDYDDHSSRQSSKQTMIIKLFLGSLIQDLNADNAHLRLKIEVSKAFVHYIHSCNDDIRKQYLTTKVGMELSIIRHIHRKVRRGDADRSNLTYCQHDCLKLLQECTQSESAAELPLIAAIHLEIAQLGLSMTRATQDESLISSHLDDADECFEQLRSELSALSSEHALALKSQWRAVSLDNSILLDTAIRRCKYQVLQAEIIENATRRDLEATDLWNWIQKSKGRAVNDLLGVDATLPRQMVEMAHQLNGGKEMLDEWIEKRQSLLRQPTHQGRRELHALELQMQRIPEIRELVALARGKAVNITDMNALFGTLPEAERTKIVLVDWYAPASDQPDVEELMMITFRYNTAPRMFQLDPDLMRQARSWINSIPGSTTPEWSKAWQEVQKVRALIEPLLEVTEPDDLLVLCPTGVLHRFPFHALLLPSINETNGKEDHKGDITLLERNALVYTPSMSLFRLCAYARIVPPTSSLPDVSSFRAAIATPLPRGGPSARALARFLGCETSEVEAVDIEEVISICEEADFFQFYGHVHNHDEVNPINAHLLLYTGPNDSRENATCDGTHDKDAMLSVKDIISRVKFREGAHVNLIACRSGVAYAAQGDDMLSLLSAIFLAGARSACTTLWNVISDSADDWIELLIAEWKLAKGRSDKRANFINLARCARDASLKLMKEDGNSREDNMQDWAPYIYHGFWDVRDK